MNATAIFLIGIHIIYFCGSILFAYFPLDRSRERAPWARWLFFTVALLVMLLALHGFAADFHFSLPLPRLPFWLAEFVIQGFVLGVIFALIVSGQLYGKKLVRSEVAA